MNREQLIERAVRRLEAAVISLPETKNFRAPDHQPDLGLRQQPPARIIPMQVPASAATANSDSPRLLDFLHKRFRTHKTRTPEAA